MGTPYKLTPDRVDEFFSLLALAHSVKYACKMIGVSRDTVYAHRRDNPAFAIRWEEAEKEGLETLRDELRRRAVDGVENPVYYQGTRVGSTKYWSDNLLMFEMKRRDPEYRDGGVNVNIKGKVDEVVFTRREDERKESPTTNKQKKKNTKH